MSLVPNLQSCALSKALRRRISFTGHPWCIINTQIMLCDTQLYTNATVPCPGAEHIYLAFPNRYVQDRVPNPDHPYPGVNDALFMASRDCVHWTRYLEAWVRPGLDPLNWTDRNNYPTWGIVQTSDNEWSLYISEHYRHPDCDVRACGVYRYDPTVLFHCTRIMLVVNVSPNL